MLIGQILIVLLTTYLSSLLQKFHFPVVLNSFQTQKDLELVSRLLFLWNFSIIIFLFVI